MDSYYIKLHATHSQVKMRLAEIRFDLRHTIKQIKVIEVARSTNFIRRCLRESLGPTPIR